MDSCMYCKSGNIEKGLKMRGSKQIGNLHFQYSALGTEAEEILADLCRDCGSITRFYVANAKRDWFKGLGK